MERGFATPMNADDHGKPTGWTPDTSAISRAASFELGWSAGATGSRNKRPLTSFPDTSNRDGASLQFPPRPKNSSISTQSASDVGPGRSSKSNPPPILSIYRLMSEEDQVAAPALDATDATLLQDGISFDDTQLLQPSTLASVSSVDYTPMTVSTTDQTSHIIAASTFDEFSFSVREIPVTHCTFQG